MSGFVRRLAGIPWRSIAGDALSRVFLVAQAFCAVHVVEQHLCSLAVGRGPSMLPTLNLAGDVLAVDRVSVRLGRVASGDVVLMISPEDLRKSITKRVVGMQGDSVTYLVDPGNSFLQNHCGEWSGELVTGLGFWVKIPIWSLGRNALTLEDGGF
jgi:inner membrane protease subunit 1